MANIYIRIVRVCVCALSRFTISLYIFPISPKSPIFPDFAHLSFYSNLSYCNPKGEQATEGGIFASNIQKSIFMRFKSILEVMWN